MVGFIRGRGRGGEGPIDPDPSGPFDRVGAMRREEERRLVEWLPFAKALPPTGLDLVGRYTSLPVLLVLFPFLFSVCLVLFIVSSFIFFGNGIVGCTR